MGWYMCHMSNVRITHVYIKSGKMGEGKANLVKSINSNVFDAFKTLTSDVVGDRLNGGIILMQYVNEISDDVMLSEKLHYILNRLVRGLGASTSSSKAGFYSTMVAFLTHPATRSLTVDEIFKAMDKELQVGKDTENKEHSDALIGRILVCQALIISEKLYNAGDEEISKCVSLLAALSNHKIFHSSLAYESFIELLSKLPSNQFNAVMWPIMKEELKRPWKRQNINTIRFLLAVHAKYPELIDSEYLKSAINAPEILSPTSFEHLIKIFCIQDNKSTSTHPAYNEFAQFLCKINPDLLINFWKQVDQCQESPSKVNEVTTIKMLTVFCKSDSITTKTLLKLLSNGIIKMIVKSLKNVPRLNRHSLVDYYDKFFDAVKEHMSKTDKKKVKIISKFILHPGALTIEKYTTHDVVRQMILQLGSADVIEMTEIYKKVFFGELPKDPTDATVEWLNVEKQYAAQMIKYLIGLKVMQNEIDWRIEQSKFMAGVSLFYTSKEGRPVTERKDIGFITKDFGLKNMFYSTLQAKLPNLKDAKRMLLELVNFCNEYVTHEGSEKYLREPMSKKSLLAWKKMFQFANSPKVTSKNDKKLDLIFRILFMHMGLQLFTEPKMAEVAINDLEKCVENISKKKKKSNKLNAVDEPQWIEVVIDLFLHLLSRGTKFFKIVVNTLFPHLCPLISMTALHQILSVLDMKVSNPLSNEGEGDDDQMNGGDHEENSDGDEDDDDTEEEGEGESDSDEEEEEDDDVIEEEEGTVSDHLRNDLFNVLGATSDAESIDVDDLTQEEADNLDKSLSAVFQLRKKSSKKKSKQERTVATTVMHFRIRVLDLIDIYIKSTPPMAMCLEIITALFNMVEFCVESDLKPLSDRIVKVLIKLLKLRNFVNVTDVTEEHLRDLLNGLIDRKVNPIKWPSYEKLLSNSVSFAVSNLHLLPITDNSVATLIKDRAKEFFNTRKPTITFDLLRDIFKLRWIGVWEIALSLSENDKTIENLRAFRRNQLLELLGIMYKNTAFISQNIKSFHKINDAITTNVTQYLDGMHQLTDVKPKECSALVSLLCEMYKCSTKVESLKTKQKINWKLIGEQVQNIRMKLILAPIPSYQQFCTLLGMKAVKKFGIQPVHQNGNGDINEILSEDEVETEKNHRKRKLEETPLNSKQMRAMKMKKNRKLGKQKGLTEGLNDNVV